MTYFDDYKIVDEEIHVFPQGSEEAIPFCEELWISEIQIDLLQQTQMIAVSFRKNGTIITTPPFPRKKALKAPIDYLSVYGLSIASSMVYNVTVAEILMETEPDATVTFYHTTLGFVEFNQNELIFLAHEPISTHNIPQSTYFFPQRTRPKGVLSEWKTFIEQQVLGHTNLELALSLSVTAPVVFLLKRANLLSELPLWALIGPSSTGKTSALKLMASVWGSPEESTGLLYDLHATQNAIYELCTNNQGIPILIDETSSVPEWDFGKFLYNLPKGHGKVRCDSQGNVRNVNCFSGTVIFTGENSLFHQTSKNDGLYARLVEFTLPWTDNAEHAEAVEYGSRQYYGTAAVPIASWLLQNEDQLLQTYQSYYDLFKSQIPLSPSDHIDNRLLKKYAIILTSAYVISQSLGLELKADEIILLLKDIHESNLPPKEECDKIDLAYDRLIGYINSTSSPDDAYIKRAQKNGEKPCVWIADSVYREIIHIMDDDKAGLKEINDGLYKRGYIKRFGDRYAVRHSIGKIERPACYCVYLSIEKKDVPKKKRSSIIDDFLSNDDAEDEDTDKDTSNDTVSETTTNKQLEAESETRLPDPEK